MVYGRKPNLVNLREFGAKLWVHNAGNSKLEGWAGIGRWLGYDTQSSGHRIYWPDRHSIGVERSVRFDEYADVYLLGEVQNAGKRRKTFSPPPGNLRTLTTYLLHRLFLHLLGPLIRRRQLLPRLHPCQLRKLRISLETTLSRMYRVQDAGNAPESNLRR
jgi:hypothetical protein